nr:HU family DNA-binding protein [Deinococcus deserti]
MKHSEKAVSVQLEGMVQAVRSVKSVGLSDLGTLSVRENAARTDVRPSTSRKIQDGHLVEKYGRANKELGYPQNLCR